MRAEISKTRATVYTLILIVVSASFLVISLIYISPKLVSKKIGSLNVKNTNYCLRISDYPVSLMNVQFLESNIRSVSLKGDIDLGNNKGIVSLVSYATFGPQGKLYAAKIDLTQDDLTYSLEERGTETAILEYSEKKANQTIVKKSFSVQGPLLLVSEEFVKDDVIEFYLPEAVSKSSFSVMGGAISLFLSTFEIVPMHTSECKPIPLFEIEKAREIGGILTNILQTIEHMKQKES